MVSSFALCQIILDSIFNPKYDSQRGSVELIMKALWIYSISYEMVKNVIDMKKYSFPVAEYDLFILKST